MDNIIENNGIAESCSSTEDNTLLEVKDLVVHYETEDEVVEAVNNISFTVNKGEVFGLVGETGAGKTTVALSIMKLLPEMRGHIINGQIICEGEDLVTKTNKEMVKIRGNKISMIFQDPMTALNPVKRIGDQIEEVIALHNPHLSKREVMLAGMKMLREVGIQEERYKDYPFQFSGGMKQRVIIAIALACEPDLIIADEPTTALDVTIQAQVLTLMKELIAKYNTSVILITHDFGVVSEICDRCAIMYGGEIVECGTLDDIFRNAKHPYTFGLFDALPKLSDKGRRLKPIPGMMPDPTKLPQYCTFADRCGHCTDVCRSGEPPQTWLSAGHMVKCFHYDEARSGEKA